MLLVGDETTRSIVGQTRYYGHTLTSYFSLSQSFTIEVSRVGEGGGPAPAFACQIG